MVETPTFIPRETLTYPPPYAKYVKSCENCSPEPAERVDLSINDFNFGSGSFEAANNEDRAQKPLLDKAGHPSEILGGGEASYGTSHDLRVGTDIAQTATASRFRSAAPSPYQRSFDCLGGEARIPDRLLEFGTSEGKAAPSDSLAKGKMVSKKRTNILAAGKDRPKKWVGWNASRKAFAGLEMKPLSLTSQAFLHKHNLDPTCWLSFVESTSTKQFDVPAWLIIGASPIVDEAISQSLDIGRKRDIQFTGPPSSFATLINWLLHKDIVFLREPSLENMASIMAHLANEYIDAERLESPALLDFLMDKILQSMFVRSEAQYFRLETALCTRIYCLSSAGSKIRYLVAALIAWKGMVALGQSTYFTTRSQQQIVVDGRKHDRWIKDLSKNIPELVSDLELAFADLRGRDSNGQMRDPRGPNGGSWERSAFHLLDPSAAITTSLPRQLPDVSDGNIKKEKVNGLTATVRHREASQSMSIFDEGDSSFHAEGQNSSNAESISEMRVITGVVDDNPQITKKRKGPPEDADDLYNISDAEVERVISRNKMRGSCGEAKQKRRKFDRKQRLISNKPERGMAKLSSAKISPAPADQTKEESNDRIAGQARIETSKESSVMIKTEFMEDSQSCNAIVIDDDFPLSKSNNTGKTWNVSLKVAGFQEFSMSVKRKLLKNNSGRLYDYIIQHGKDQQVTLDVPASVFDLFICWRKTKAFPSPQEGDTVDDAETFGIPKLMFRYLCLYKFGRAMNIYVCSIEGMNRVRELLAKEDRYLTYDEMSYIWDDSRSPMRKSVEPEVREASNGLKLFSMCQMAQQIAAGGFQVANISLSVFNAIPALAAAFALNGSKGLFSKYIKKDVRKSMKLDPRGVHNCVFHGSCYRHGWCDPDYEGKSSAADLSSISKIEASSEACEIEVEMH